MPRQLYEVDTPTLVVHESIALANIERFQGHCNDAGLKLRPHIKTHKSIHFTRLQLQAGAAGITCQKIGEAEVMAAAGVEDILITFNILGEAKLKRLAALASQLTRLGVVADNATVIEGLSAAFARQSTTLHVMVECDTGAARCGVQTPQEAADLAALINRLPGLEFAGLMTYPDKLASPMPVQFMRDTIAKLNAIGINCPDVSTGGTPLMWDAASDGIFTEYRIGTYIYQDRSMLERGICTEADCAARVVATVVSRPTSTRLVIDAGSKVLTSDLLGMQGHGHVLDFPDATIAGLSEEHGVLQVSADNPLQPGDQIEIVPNHVCVVSNMFDEVQLIRQGGTIEPLTIDARGKVL
jgi:D-serine deaminase-like pyridoxal phosphate-dependent protein